jgi:hypothetical protein
MTPIQAPRDWFSTFAGLTIALLLAIYLGWAFWGPATRIARAEIREVWVTIVPATPPKAPPVRH